MLLLQALSSLRKACFRNRNIFFGAEIEVAAAFYSDPEPSKVKQIALNRCSIFAFSKGIIGTLYPGSLKKYPAPRDPGDLGRTPVYHLQFWCPGRNAAMVGVRPGHLAEWGSVCKARFPGHFSHRKSSYECFQAE